MTFPIFFYLCSASWLGYECLSLLLHIWIDPLTLLGLAIPFGIVTFSWFFFATTVYVGYSFLFGLCSCFFCLLLALFLHFLPRERHKHRPLPLYQFVLSVAVPCSFIFYLLYTSLFAENKYIRGDVYADLPFHLNLISSMLYGCNRDRQSLYDMTSPFYSGLPLAYPVIPNFLSALMMRMFGSGYHKALYIPSLFFAFSLFANLIAITRKFTRGNTFAILVAPWLWIFMGGRGFLWWFYPEIRQQRPDYIHHWGNDTYNFWFQNTAHVMLPQRSSLFGLPVAFAVIIVSMHIDFNRLDWRLFLAMGMIVAALPQVQPHSVIALFEYSIGLVVVNIQKLSFDYVKHFAIYGITTVVIAFPQLIPYFSRTVGESKGHFFEPMLLWNHRKRGPIGFWYDGLGPFVVLALFHGMIVADRQQLNWYLPTLFVFVASNFILYQPWFMDNTKVFNAGWTAMAIAVVANFLSKIRVFLSIPLIFFCCISGSIPVYRMLGWRGQFWYDGNTAWQLANWAKEHTSPKSIWITGGYHAHPVVCLAGRQTFLGPYNYLSNHGVDPGRRYQIMDRLVENPENTAQLDRYNVSYLCQTSGQREFFLKISNKSEKWKKRVEIGRYTIWERVGRV